MIRVASELQNPLNSGRAGHTPPDHAAAPFLALIILMGASWMRGGGHQTLFAGFLNFPGWGVVRSGAVGRRRRNAHDRL